MTVPTLEVCSVPRVRGTPVPAVLLARVPAAGGQQPGAGRHHEAGRGLQLHRGQARGQLPRPHPEQDPDHAQQVPAEEGARQHSLP